MKIYLKHLFALSLFTFLAVSASAQSKGEITGSLTAEDGEPVSFATVMLMNSKDSTMTKANSSDLDGSYTLLGAPTGEYYVEVTYIGYGITRSDVFSYTAGTSYTVPAMQLRAASEQLDEVVVKSARPLIEVHPDKTIFNVDGSINATGNTALELLRKSPGVVVDNNDNIILAGKNGVQVYIDDKPSPLSTEDLANFLKTMQSSEIDNIEIITNPSAKFDAEGNAGIINIRLKKDKSLGTNGSVDVGYRYGRTPKYSANANLNHRNKDLNLFGSYGFFHGDFENEMNFYREQQGSFYQQENDMLHGNQSHNFRLGSDFFVSDKSTLGFLFSGNINDNEGQAETVTLIGPINGELESILDATSRRQGERNNLNFNINYLFRGDNDLTWNLDLDYGRFRNETESVNPNRYYDPTHTTVTSVRDFSTQAPTDINIYTAKADHERNWLGGKFGIGVKVSLVETDNTFNFFDIPDGDPILNLDRSNNFVFEENINAGYFSFNRKLKEKWNMSLGLRVENTNSTGTLMAFGPVDNEIVERHYTDFFPSAGLTYQLNQKNSFRLNYSRRIDRPSYQDLNPFEFKLDELSFMQGNAFLKPQYSNSISLTHTYNYRLNTSLSYTRTNDVFTRITKAHDEIDSTSILTFENLAKQTNLALTVSMPFEVSKWWSVYGNITAYRLHNEANLNGDIIDLNANVLSFYAQNTFLLPKGFKFELSGWYNSPSIWEGNWTNESMYSVDIGLQKKLLNDRANLKISFSDLLNTQGWNGESRFGALYIRGGGNWESQQLRVNFSYLFGNTQVKSARKRDTGLEDENSRIKTDN